MGKAVLFCLTAVVAAAQSVSLTVNTSGSLHTIDEKIYGQFLEHIYHSANGGVWGDVVWNRSFEESLAEGEWKVDSGVLEVAGDGRFRFGAETWRDYEVSLDVARPAGNGALSVGVRSNRNANYALSMGGPRGFELSRTGTGEAIVLQTAAGQLENARWYHLRMRIEGQRLQVWIDGRVLFDVSAGGGPANGFGFVAARGGAANFAHLAVKSTAGAALMSGVPTAARHWSAVGTGELALDAEAPLNSKRSLRMIARAADAGVEQTGLAVRAGDTLRGSLWAAGTGPGMTVRLIDGAKVLAEQTLGAPGAEWKEFPLALTPNATAGNATLRILARARSNVKLDQVSLMPDSWRANGGFRPDLTQAIAALHPPIIRWPGGSFVNNFRWKDSVGPQSRRVGKNGWDEWDPLAFGLDEFMTLTRKVGAEPVIVVWVGPRTQVDRAPYVQDVLDLIEYCNGSAETTWGKVRAQNGHPQPYGVKYFELDNEVWSMPAAEYANVLAQFVPAMRKADPAIRTIAAGSGQLGTRWGEGDLAVIRSAAQYADYLSVHHYENADRFGEGPAAAENFWRSLAAEIAGSKNPRMKLFVSEWNAQSTDWRTGLYAGGILNAMERDPAVAMATPALFLRHVSAPAWDNALINFDQRSWFPAPNYVVMKMFREHYAPELLSITGSPGELNATATRSADGDRIVVKVVNPSAHEVALDVALLGDFPLLAAGMKMVAPDSLEARNTLEKPDAVRVVDGKIERLGMKARVTMPRWSVAVITLTR